MVRSATEGRGAGDEHRRAGIDGLTRRRGVNAAIDLDLHRQLLFGDLRGDDAWIQVSNQPTRQAATQEFCASTTS